MPRVVIKRVLWPRVIGIGAACFLMLAPASARAESLKAALVAAYGANPQLNAERAKLRALDETVPQALSGWRPSVSGAADAGWERTRFRTATTRAKNEREPRGYSLSVTQPVFSGFRTINSTSKAEAGVLAGRAALRNVEQGVLLDAVTAYMNVKRDLSIVRLRRNNVTVLSEQLRATRDRFKVGEVTRTDVAQSEARRAGSLSALNFASASLSSSRASYRQVIGHPPNGLSHPPSIEHKLPRNQQDAIDIAAIENPAIVAAIHNEEAAHFDIKRVAGEFLPSVSLEAKYAERWDPSISTLWSETTTITGRLSVPLYQAGEVSARLRQAKETKSQRRLEIDRARQDMRAAVVSAWGQLAATRAQIISDRAQVRANGIALSGVREEAKVGQRTTLDILDAEQEMLDARVALAGTRRDLIVASYSLLSAIGRLSAADLELPVARYDPEDHFEAVRDKAFGFDPAFLSPQR